MSNTKIEWCDKVWNPITGCSPVSEGCRNCYARRMANRLKGRYGYPKDEPFRVTFHPDRLEEPLHWKKPSRIFVGSMTDIFHEEIHPLSIRLILGIIEKSTHHIFMILTKRPKRMEDMLNHNSMFVEDPNIKNGWRFKSISNLYLGVSVEDQKTADERIPVLLQIPAAHHFVSVEPMLSNIYIPKYYFVGALPAGYEGFIDWVVAGCETGPGARPLHPDWVRSLRDQCQTAGVPFFFKSWGEWMQSGYDATHLLNVDGRFVKRSEAMLHISDTREDDLVDRGHPGWLRVRKVGKKLAGHLLDGKEWREFPK